MIHLYYDYNSIILVWLSSYQQTTLVFFFILLSLYAVKADESSFRQMIGPF